MGDRYVAEQAIVIAAKGLRLCNWPWDRRTLLYGSIDMPLKCERVIIRQVRSFEVQCNVSIPISSSVTSVLERLAWFHASSSSVTPFLFFSAAMAAFSRSLSKAISSPSPRRPFEKFCLGSESAGPLPFPDAIFSMCCSANDFCCDRSYSAFRCSSRAPAASSIL